jgi:hypothetical protein
MAYPQHWLFQFGGTLLAGAEIIRFAVPGGGAPGIVDETSLVADMTQDVADQWPLGFSAGGLGAGDDVQLEWGKFNEIGPLGAYVDTTATHVHELTTPVSGNGSGIGIAQVAMAVSWGTDVARGYASKGRVFVPIPGVSPISGVWTDTWTNAIATNWSTLLTNLNNLPGIDSSGIVASVVSSVPAAGAARPIQRVRVGNVPDTIRRRRNALVEVYSSATVA